jgi:hypothetical protein
MFFTTKHWVATAFNNTIQVWKTTTDIKVLFLVEYVTPNSLAISALPQLYKNIFSAKGNSNLTDLDIKHWDIKTRNKLASKLYNEYKVSGWLSSIENKVEMEVCLFDKQANSKQLILVETTDINDKKYFKDSLQRITIYPSKTFLKQTEKALTQHTSIEDSYRQHRKFFNAGIKQYSSDEYGMTKNEAKHYMLDLRIKMKV